jgi:hypothetical protein
VERGLPIKLLKRLHPFAIREKGLGDEGKKA